MKISKEQIKIIYTLGQELGLVDRMTARDLLHEMVESMTGKCHVTDMTSLEAIQIIDRLKSGMKGSDRIRTPQNSNIQNRATQAQKGKIWRLMFEIRKLDKEPSKISLDKRLRGFLKKYAAGVDDINFITSAQAWRVIEGLKGLLESESGIKSARTKM